jgi:AraC-like DNA-binding protein
LASQALSFQKSPSLPFVEMRQAVHSSACFHTHTHDEFSFGVIDTGKATYQNRGHNHRIGQGTMVTINPADAHSCNPDAGAWSYRMLFVNTQWLGQLQQEMFGTHELDYCDFSTQKREDQHLLSAFNELYQALNLAEPSLHAETSMVTLIRQLFPEQRIKDAAANNHKADTARDLILDELNVNHSLAEFSEQTGLSRFHFIRSFKERYGQTPHAFQLDQRINKAKTLLQKGESLSGIALDLGFSDQAHFQRHFKKRIAVTPKQYQSFFVS